MPDKNHFIIYRGARRLLSAEIKESDKVTPFDLTGYTATIIIKFQPEDSDDSAPLSKELAIDDPPTGVVTIDLLPSETNGLITRILPYPYKIKIDDGDSDIQYPIVSTTVVKDA